MPDRAKIFRIHSAFVDPSSWSGSSTRAYGAECRDLRVVKWASTTILRNADWSALVPGFLVGTCSVLSAAPGRTRAGKVGGARCQGVATIRQYLQAHLLDELHLAIRPLLMGSGEQLWHGIDLRALGYECAESIAGERATHVFLRKRE